MATKIDAGEVVKTQAFLVFPENIQVDFATNGRSKLHSDASLMEMVESLKQHGQLEDVVVRKVEGDKLALVAGFRRWRAVTHINQNKLLPEPLPLRCRLVHCNAEEAFVKNLVENMHRDDLTPLDHAHNQRELREKHGWDEKKIADFYGMSVMYVYQLKKCVQLPGQWQDLVKNKQLSVVDACELLQLPEAEANVLIETSKDETGNVDQDKLKNNMREKAIDNGKKKARTQKEVRDFLLKRAENEKLGAVCNLFLSFLSGAIADSTMHKKLLSLVKEPEPVVEEVTPSEEGMEAAVQEGVAAAS